MEKELIRLLLSQTFYELNKSKITKEIFPNNMHLLISIIQELHEKYKKDITIAELKAVYKVTYPTTTKAQWDLLEEILDNIPAEISDDVAKEIIHKAWAIEMGRQISQEGINIINGKQTSFAKIRAAIEAYDKGIILTGEDIEQVSSDLEDILAAIDITTKWPFNLEPLHRVASGVGEGVFTVIVARVETGKTAFAISLSSSPGGFADQGGIVNYYANEESAQRTQGRSIMSYTGRPLHDILLHKDETKEAYKKIKNNLRFYECRSRSITDIDAHIAKHSPDIVIIDQLDHLSINGSFAREDERLSALYCEARDIAVRRSCAVIGITQANAAAEGKIYLSSANLSNSLTGKAAAADVILGLGKSPIHDDNTRIINMVKSKLTGRHDDVVCMIRPEVSRFVA